MRPRIPFVLDYKSSSLSASLGLGWTSLRAIVEWDQGSLCMYIHDTILLEVTMPHVFVCDVIEDDEATKHSYS